MQIAGADLPESRRQTEAQQNKQVEAEANEKAANKRSVEVQKIAKAAQRAKQFINYGREDYCGEQRDEEFNVVPVPEPQAAPAKKKYNTMEIPTLALASMRHHTGMRETAEIATATLIDAGVITEDDTSLVIDHSKVKRAQEKLFKELEKKV